MFKELFYYIRYYNILESFILELNLLICSFIYLCCIRKGRNRDGNRNFKLEMLENDSF